MTAGGCINTAGRERAPFLTRGHAAKGLLNQIEHAQNTGELVDSEILLRGTYSADQWSVVQWIMDRTSNHRSDGASLSAVLVLSLAIWAAIWEAVASLAYAFL